MADHEAEEGLEEDLEEDLEGDIDELKVFIAKANGDIEKVETEILKVKKKITDVKEEITLLKCEQNKEEDVRQLREKEKQLREKEKQLREELRQLREKEKQRPVKKMKYMTKKEMKIDDAKKLQLNPLDATWDIMVLANILFDWFKIFDIPKLEIVDKMQSVTVPGDQLLMLKANSVPSCESYSSHVCYYVMCGVVEYLNSKAASKKYRVVADPIVMQVEKDCQKNKKSDLAIYRLVNERTIVVLEVKLLVGNSITSCDKDSLAQLFYEVRLVSLKEGSTNQNTLAIYGNHDTWHFFLVQNSPASQKILYRSSISELSTQSVMNTIAHYLELL